MENLQLKFVYKNLTESEKQKVINLWRSIGVLSEERAKKRVEQVCLIIINKNDEIVGVSTVYTHYIVEESNLYFFYRMFIKKEYRGSPKIYIKVLQIVYNQLKTHYAQKLNGLIIELENKKIAKLGSESSYMNKLGFTYYGLSSRKLQLWYVRFDDPKGIFV